MRHASACTTIGGEPRTIQIKGTAFSLPRARVAVRLRHMNRRLRTTALLLALAAICLRAAIAPGWMPAATGAGAFVMCTAQGFVTVAPDALLDDAPQAPQPDDDASSLLHCPFAPGAMPVITGTLVPLDTAAPAAREALPWRAAPVLAASIHAPFQARAPPA